MATFVDRIDAGRALGEALASETAAAPVILGLPRGGVVVAAEVARALDAPLDVLVVKKIGVPGYEELAMGAAAEGGIVLKDERTCGLAGIDDEAFARAAGRAQEALDARARRYRALRAREPLRARTVVLVDDGIATGATMLAAIRAARAAGAARVIVAAPVLLGDSAAKMRARADDVVSLLDGRGMFAVGEAYEAFGQVSDDEVESLLKEGGRGPTLATRAPTIRG